MDQNERYIDPNRKCTYLNHIICQYVIFDLVEKKRLALVAPRLIRFMSDWMEAFPYDFRDDAIMELVRSVTQKCVAVEPELLSAVTALLRNLLQRLTNLEHYEEFLQEVAQNSVKHAVDKLPPVGDPATLNRVHQDPRSIVCITIFFSKILNCLNGLTISMKILVYVHCCHFKYLPKIMQNLSI